MPHLPDTILQVLAPFAPLFSDRVWRHAQVFLLGAMLTPGARTVTAALRVMGLATERHFTNYHRVLNRATWSARQGSRILLGVMITLLVPPGATIVFGADDTLERRSGRQIKAKGCYRDAVRSSKNHVIRCFGLKWVVDDALGARALEPASMGVAVSDRVVPACGASTVDAGIRPASIGSDR